MLHIFLKKNTDYFDSESVFYVSKKARLLQKSNAILLLRLLLVGLHGKTSEQMDRMLHG